MAGREDGGKHRPCAIILALRDDMDITRVLAVPITHSLPSPATAAMELPLPVKRHLGLDDGRSWTVYSESNLFRWPGPDLRPAAGRHDGSIAYGFLPPKYFAELRLRFLALETAVRSGRVPRSE